MPKAVSFGYILIPVECCGFPRITSQEKENCRASVQNPSPLSQKPMNKDEKNWDGFGTKSPSNISLTTPLSFFLIILMYFIGFSSLIGISMPSFEKRKRLIIKKERAFLAKLRKLLVEGFGLWWCLEWVCMAGLEGMDEGKGGEGKGRDKGERRGGRGRRLNLTFRTNYFTQGGK